MAAWPVGLPPPRVAGAGEQIGRKFDEFEGDKRGASIRRKVTTAAPALLTVTYRLTAAQVTTLFSFYDDECGNRFTFTHPRSLASVNAEFAGEPQVAPAPNVARYDATVQLKIYG